MNLFSFGRIRALLFLGVLLTMLLFGAIIKCTYEEKPVPKIRTDKETRR